MDDQAVDKLQQVRSNARALCKRTWWVFLIGGIAALIFGILAFVNPAMALLVLATYFAAMVMIDGVVNIVGALGHREKDGWWVLLLLGIAGMLIGGYALINPPVSIGAFVFLVAFAAIFMGMFLIVLGRKLADEIEREWILYLCGGLSAAWGVLILFSPESGAISVVHMIGAWAIVIGVLKILFSFKARSFASGVGERLAEQRSV